MRYRAVEEFDLSDADVPRREMIYVPAVIVTPRRQEFSVVLRWSLNEISAGMLISLAFFFFLFLI